LAKLDAQTQAMQTQRNLAKLNKLADIRPGRVCTSPWPNSPSSTCASLAGQID